MLSSFNKLRGRSASELFDRARQGASRWLERRGIGDLGEPEPSRIFASEAEAAPAIRGPFFASIAQRDATLRALQECGPEYLTRLRSRADRLLGGSFDLLGHQGLAFGDPVDWWLDPVSGRRAPDRHWSGINFLDPGEVGDHKLVWELSRHNALVTLAQAAWCTGDRRYAEHCLTLLRSWLDANPPKRGLHWSSSLELSFRSMAWLWVLAMVDDVMPAELRRRAIGYIAVAARHIERHLSTWFSPNTHLTGEALGLFVIGTALPQCRDAARWQRLGADILLEWVDRHVRPDGSYVEQSTWYHRYTTDFYLHFLVLAERAGISVRGKVEGPLTRLLEYLMWVTRPDGSMPLIGDDDGGRLLFLDERTAHDTRTPLALGAALFGRGDFAAIGGAAPPELVWLLGEDGVRQHARVQPRLPSEKSRSFPDGGAYVMRSGWSASDHVMVIDAGPHGFLNAGHAHADALSLDLTISGRPVLVDPGTFTYTTSPAWRDAFRETAAHNAATVDGCGSAAVGKPFQWATRVEARCEQWETSEEVVLFAGTHDGFERLRPPVRYTRYVAYFLPDIWVVCDEISGEGEHELAAHWQCAPGLVCHGGAGSLTLSKGREQALELRVAGRAQWRFTDAWVSPTYGVREIASHVYCTVSGAGASRLTTVLCAPGLGLSVREEPNGVRLRWGAREEVLFFEDRRVRRTTPDRLISPTE